jgi:hypothetical protein
MIKKVVSEREEKTATASTGPVILENQLVVPDRKLGRKVPAKTTGTAMDLMGQTLSFLLKGVQWSGLSIHHSFLLYPVDESTTEYLSQWLYFNDNHYIPSYACWM